MVSQSWSINLTCSQTGTCPVPLVCSEPLNFNRLCSLILSYIALLISPYSHGIFVNNPVPFRWLNGIIRSHYVWPKRLVGYKHSAYACVVFTLSQLCLSQGGRIDPSWQIMTRSDFAVYIFQQIATSLQVETLISEFLGLCWELGTDLFVSISKTTLTRPLSASKIMIDSSCLRSLRVFCISFVMLGIGGIVFYRKLFRVPPVVSAFSWTSFVIADSTLITISVVGMLGGVTSKFNPFSSKDISASRMDGEDRLLTHLLQSKRGVMWTLVAKEKKSLVLLHKY